MPKPQPMSTRSIVIAAMWILMAALFFGLLLVMSGANVSNRSAPPQSDAPTQAP